MIILEALLYAIPIYIANACAALSASIPGLKNWRTPIDQNKVWNNNRILGDGKTFRGLIFGTACGTLSAFLQYQTYQLIAPIYLSDLKSNPLSFSLLLGLLLGFGALLGDIIKSFIKRRVGIKQGRPCPPFDQIDFLIGGLLLSSLLYQPDPKLIGVLFIITPAIHLASNIIAYNLKIKDVWW